MCAGIRERPRRTVSYTHLSYTKQKNDWETVLNVMASGKLDVKPFITHRFPLKDINSAFEMVRDKKEFSNRVIFIME